MGEIVESTEVVLQLLNFTQDFANNLDIFNLSTQRIENASNWNMTEIRQQSNSCSCGAPEWLSFIAISYTKNVHGVASLCVCAIGALANTLNLIVLTRRDLRAAPVNKILSCIALADMFLMLEYIPFAFEMYLDTERARRMFLQPWAIYLLLHMHASQVLHTISIMLTLLLASWRCLTLAQLTPPSPSRSHPAAGGGGPGAIAALQSSRTLTLALICCLLIPLLLCAPSFLCFTVKPMVVPNTNTTRYVIKLSQLAHENDGALYHFQFWFYAVLVKLVPCLLLTVLSVCLIRALLRANRHSQRLLSRPENVPMVAIENSTNFNVNTPQQRSKKAAQRTDRTTRMLVAVTLLFLCTEFPHGILGLLSGIYGPCFFLTCYQLLGDILDMLALLNGTVNFILYCAMSRQFRVMFCRLFIPGSTCSPQHAAMIKVAMTAGNTATNAETVANTMLAAAPSDSTGV